MGVRGKEIFRLKKSNEMQLYADIYLLLNYPKFFGRPSRPSSGVHKNIVAASGTDHTIWGAISPHIMIYKYIMLMLKQGGTGGNDRVHCYVRW